MTNARTLSLAALLFGLFLTTPVSGQAPSVSEPESRSVLSGSNVSFAVVASGAAPLSYQWRLAGSNIPGATSSTLVLSNVQFTAGGPYQVVVTNVFGAVTSSPAFLSVDEHLTFRIVELQTNNAIALEHGAVTGDDRGGIAVGSEFVHVTGDNATARFSAANLTGGTGLGTLRDSLCSNLKSERIYVLANGNTPIGYGGGTVNGLIELDPASGAPNGSRINLSTNIPFNGFGVGIFSGYDRIVLWDGFNTYHVALPSGQVSQLPSVPGLSRTFSESWAFWGLVEYHANRFNLVYVENFQRIVRRTVGGDAQAEPIATFNSLSDMASIGFSTSRSRWYFHHEGSSQFRSGDETVGSAKALFTTNAGFPAIFQTPQDQTGYPGDTVTFTVLAGGSAPLSYQWRVDGINIAGGTNQNLILSNITPSAVGTYSVLVSNSAGTTVSSGGFLYVISSPEIFAQPQPAAVLPGTNVSFSVGVLAAPPVSFQWLHNGTNVANATNAVLQIPFATVAHAGAYQVSITNRFGGALSEPVMLSIIVESPYSFRILALSNDAVVVEHSELTGDDAGGIAVSSQGVFVTGDGQASTGATALFPAATLNGGITLPDVYPALVTDLRTEKVFSLGDGTNRYFTTPATQINSLIEIDGATGAQTTNVILLSQSIPLNLGEVGLFSGYGQIVIHNGATVFSIAVPSGVVSILGQMPFLPSHQPSETWAFWGLAENFGNSVYLVYVQHSSSIVRTRVPDGQTTTVANFLYLSDMASIGASVSRGRWYFHHQNTSEFGGTNETVGYASARFSIVSTPVVDHFNWSPLPAGQFSGVPFPVTVTARTIDDLVLSNFNGTVALAGLTVIGNQPVPITTDATISFTNGVWTGEIIVPQPTPAMYVRATDQAGRFGLSGAFDVVTTNDLALQVFPSTNAATLYAALTYSLELTNTGPQASSGVFATNVLPANVNFISATSQQGGCSLNGRTVVCDVGTMPGGSGVRIEIVVVPTSLATLTNATRVIRAAVEGHPENNVATNTIPVSMPVITITDSESVEGNSGATRGTNVFTVQLNTTSAVPVSVQFATAVGTASNTVDYVNRSGTLTFAPGVTTTNVRVTIVTDLSYEGDEVFFVNFSNAVNATLVRAQAVGRILNDDPAPRVVVTNTVVTEGNSGSLSASITVQLSNPATVPISISYATSNGTAQAGSDYTARSGTLTFASGITNQTFTVNIAGDTAGESNEFFAINFFDGVPFTINTQLLVVILNNDPVSVDHFLVSNIAPTQQVNVPFHPTIIAQDFNNNTVTNFNGQVSFALGTAETEIGLGTTTWNYPLSVFYEDARCQTIYLASEMRGPRRLTSLSLRVAELPSKPMANWTIRMKHTTLSAYGTAAWENSGWTVVHQSLLTVSSAGWITFNFTTPFDYNGVNNLMVDFSFDDTSYSFPDGMVFATDRGAQRTAFARCDSCNGDPKLWTTSPGPGSGSLVPDVRFGGFAGATVNPGVSGAFTNGVWSGAVRALGPVENTPLLVIDSAQRFGASLPLTVVVTDDLSLRMATPVNPAPIGESLIYSLLVSNSGPSASTGVFLTNQLPLNAAYVSSSTDRGTLSQVGSRIIANLGTIDSGSTALITIAVRPSAAGTVVNSANVRRNEAEPYLANNAQTNSVTIAPRSLSVGLAFVREGQTGTTNIPFVVSLSPVSTQTVSVAWLAQSNSLFQDPATIGTDFQTNSGVLIFPPGVTNRTILVPVIGDTRNEADETFHLVLHSATNAAITESNAIGYILNDDPLPMVTFSDVSTAEGRDGETAVTLTLSLSAASDYPVGIGLMTEDRSATFEIDYVPTNAVVIIPPGEISVPVTVHVRGDVEVEPDESFVVSAYFVENATLAVAEAHVVILNDEVGAGVLDRFQISQVPSPQTIDRPFNLSVTARDGTDAILPLNSTLSLRALSGTNLLMLAPTNFITLTQGLWSGAVTLSAPASNVVLIVTDGVGQTNQSNPFQVNVADIRILATAPPEALIEFPFNYVLVVSNAAAMPATSVAITNRFSSDVSLVNAAVEGGACFMLDGMVICTFPTLTNRQSVTVTLALNPLRGGWLTNIAHVAAFEFDPVPGNNSATNILEITGDADGDGLPDSWESQFGFSSSNPADAQEDPDGDRHTNFQEYVSGTDPANRASVLKVEVEMTELAARLSFETITGRRYRVESAPAPAGPWAMLGSELVGEGDVAVVFDPAIAGQGQRFYRLHVLR